MRGDRYIGAPCPKHPSGRGLRYRSTSNCVWCCLERSRKQRSRKRGGDDDVKWRVDGKTYIGKICVRHPDLIGLRHVRDYSCVECRRERNRAKSQKQSSPLAPWEALGDPVKRNEYNRRLDAEIQAARRLSAELFGAERERRRLRMLEDGDFLSQLKRQRVQARRLVPPSGEPDVWPSKSDAGSEGLGRSGDRSETREPEHRSPASGTSRQRQVA